MKVAKSLSSFASSIDSVSIAWKEIHWSGPTKVSPLHGFALSRLMAVSGVGFARYSSSSSAILVPSSSSASLLRLPHPYRRVYLKLYRNEQEGAMAASHSRLAMRVCCWKYLSFLAMATISVRIPLPVMSLTQPQSSESAGGFFFILL